MLAARTGLFAALALSASGGCTSEADLGSWTASGPRAQLQHDAPAQHHAARDAATADEPLDADASVVRGSPNKSSLCLRNPSLDGIPHGGPADPGVWWPPEAWDTCFNAPEDFPDPAMPGTVLVGAMCVDDATTIDPKDGSGAHPGFLPAPTHGVGYLYLDSLRGLPERTSQALCAKLEAGVTYNFAIDLASRVGQLDDGATLAAGELAIHGTTTSCGRASRPLWRSPPLTRAWQTYCVSLTPEVDATVLTLELPARPLAKAAIMIDNIRLDARCGAGVVTR